MKGVPSSMMLIPVPEKNSLVLTGWLLLTVSHDNLHNSQCKILNLQFHQTTLTFNLHSQLKQISAVCRRQSNFPKEKHFLPLDPYTYMCVLGVRNVCF